MSQTGGSGTIVVVLEAVKSTNGSGYFDERSEDSYVKEEEVLGMTYFHDKFALTKDEDMDYLETKEAAEMSKLSNNI
jgi:hypothetical protein